MKKLLPLLILILSACGLSRNDKDVTATAVPAVVTTSTPTTAASTTQTVTPTVAPTATTRPQATGAPPPTQITGAGGCTYNAQFVRDVTIPDGTVVTPGQEFTKTWRLKNTGTCAWNNTLSVVRLDNSSLQVLGNAIVVPNAAPGAEVDISLRMILPLETRLGSTVSARFQLRSPEGRNFGQQPYVEVVAGQVATACTNDSDFVADLTIPDGTVVIPGQPIVKIWRLKNSGTCAWGAGYNFVQLDRAGNPIWMNEQGAIPAPAAAPGQEIDVTVLVTVSMETPLGIEVSSRFQMRAPDGTLFGTRPYIKVRLPSVIPTSPPNCVSDADFVADVTIPDGTVVRVGQPFVKTWRLKNTGTCPWVGTHVMTIGGNDSMMATPSIVPLPSAQPGQVVDVSMTLVLPYETPLGRPIRVAFFLSDPYGNTFGATPYVEVVPGQ